MSEPHTSTDVHTLIIDRLRKAYATRSGDVVAVGDVSLTVDAGEFVCIVGPSGAGKTTLLRCIAGLLAPTGGSVSLNGVQVVGPPKGMGVVFQEYGRSLFPWMTVRQNVELPLKERGIKRVDRERLIDESLSAVGLAAAHHSYPWQLSGGMQQRVAIARAVAYEPTLLLMDEPFAAVDAQTRAELEDIVRALWDRLGVTVLFVTHDIDEAIYLGERVAVLSMSPTEVLEDVTVTLPRERNHLETRTLPEFLNLRNHVYELVQAAKGGARPESRSTPDDQTLDSASTDPLLSRRSRPEKLG